MAVVDDVDSQAHGVGAAEALEGGGSGPEGAYEDGSLGIGSLKGATR